MMQTFTIGGKAYPVIAHITTKQTGRLPLVDLPMMSDERWNELARRNAVQNFIQEFGHPPENTAQAVKWQRESIAQESEAAV